MRKTLGRKALAEHMVGKYRLGYERVALFLASILFESIINERLKKFPPDDKNMESHGSLQDKIDALKDKALKSDVLFDRGFRGVFQIFYDSSSKKIKNFSDDNCELRKEIKYRLHNFRWLRNQVMHGDFEKIITCRDDSSVDLVHYVWKELAAESFDETYWKWEKRRNQQKQERVIDALYEHDADYMVRAVEELDIKTKDPQAKGDFCPDWWRLSPLDFENLFSLRRKMVSLQKHLETWLDKKHPWLCTDILTPINTTSAYIWMPLTKEMDEPRKGICSSSVSLLATPLDLRVYIDFGGEALNERLLFYNFLQSESYKNCIQSINSIENFFVFDTEWYCFLTSKIPLQEWVSGEQVESSVSEARARIEHHRNKNLGPITWNRMLHGYISPKSALGEEGHLAFPDIEQMLESVIRLYESFENFKKG